jgi:hypothetical protein
MESKLNDPQFLHQRAVEAGKASVEARRQKSREIALGHAVDDVVSRASELTQTQLLALRAVLAPALNADEHSHLPQAS